MVCVSRAKGSTLVLESKQAGLDGHKVCMADSVQPRGSCRFRILDPHFGQSAPPIGLPAIFGGRVLR